MSTAENQEIARQFYEQGASGAREDELIAEGDRVTVRHTHYGTQTGEFAGIPPTGKQVAVSGIGILRLRDGQIVEFWHMDGFLALMQQLGAVPGPGDARA